MKLQFKLFGKKKAPSASFYFFQQPFDQSYFVRKMTGVEFAIVHEQPPVWVIQKRYRRGPAEDDVNPIATYYITGANVYQSPTIYSVIANRLVLFFFHKT